MDLGTEIHRDWVLTESGDLKLITNEDNIAQAIINRLSSTFNNLNLFYMNYGSFLYGFLGWKRNDRTLKFMEIEIGNRIMQDNRISSYNLDLEFNSDGDVDINMIVQCTTGNVNLNLVLDTQTGNVSEV